MVRVVGGGGGSTPPPAGSEITFAFDVFGAYLVSPAPTAGVWINDSIVAQTICCVSAWHKNAGSVGVTEVDILKGPPAGPYVSIFGVNPKPQLTTLGAGGDRESDSKTTFATTIVNPGEALVMAVTQAQTGGQRDLVVQVTVT